MRKILYLAIPELYSVLDIDVPLSNQTAARVLTKYKTRKTYYLQSRACIENPLFLSESLYKTALLVFLNEITDNQMCMNSIDGPREAMIIAEVVRG